MLTVAELGLAATDYVRNVGSVTLRLSNHSY
jgi:hypothetical protein